MTQISLTGPWKLAEGFLIGGGLFAVGLALQLSMGPVRWSLFAAPVNGIMLALLLAFVCLQICWWGINYLPSARGLSIHTYNVR